MKNKIIKGISIAVVVYSCVKMNEYTNINKQLELENQNLNVKIQNLEIKNDSLNKELKSTSVSLFNLKNDNKRLKQDINKDKTNRSNNQNKTLIGVFEATAYTDTKDCQGEWVGQTATGRKPKVGIVAVDPNVIPLNTKLYIPNYGFAIAGDTGGAIKGNKIDLFMDSYDECIQFGRQKVKVYIVK